MLTRGSVECGYAERTVSLEREPFERAEHDRRLSPACPVSREASRAVGVRVKRMQTSGNDEVARAACLETGGGRRAAGRREPSILRCCCTSTLPPKHTKSLVVYARVL